MKLAAVTATRLTRQLVMTGRRKVRWLEPDLDHPGLLDVDGVDEPDARGVALHDDRAGARAVAKEAHTLHQRAVGDAGRREDDVAARREIPGRVNTLEVRDAHRPAAVSV